jgi:hypothetical protein
MDFSFVCSGPDDQVFVYFTDHGAAGRFSNRFFQFSYFHTFPLGLVAFPNGVVRLIDFVLKIIDLYLYSVALCQRFKYNNYEDVRWKTVQTS